MKRYLLLFSFILIFSSINNNAKAQYYFYNDNYYYSPITYEVGASVGVMNCMTDLGGKAGMGKKFTKDLNMGSNHACFGGFVGVTYKQAIGLRLEATFGKVSASDNVLSSYANSNDLASARYHRNLNFESSISEFSLLAEVHPLFIFFNWEESENGPPRFSPYLLGGVGMFSFNPKAKLGNNLVDLQPLSTEGQGFAEYPDRPVYKLKQMNYPLGLGLKYDVSALLSLRAEFMYRILNTDYLDDCSNNYVVYYNAKNPYDPTNPDIFDRNFGYGSTKAKNARALANRQAEIDPSSDPLNPMGNYYDMGVGSKRGSPTQKDSYFSFNFKVALTLGRERIRD
jgi:hypothetical protein